MSPVIEHTSSREHQFTKLWLRQSSFTCDACGTSGNYDSHICSTLDNECGTLECEICHEEVNKDCGSYYCSDCEFILHVNCALQETSWYYKIESIVDYEKKSVVDTGDPPFSVIKDVKRGETVINTEIKHFSHQHNLVLSEVVKDDASPSVVVSPTSVWNICVLNCSAFDVLIFLWPAQVKDTSTFFALTTSIMGSTVMLVEAVRMVSQYTDARLVILICISHVFSFHNQLGTNVMNICSL
ncbi:hypothetical protein PTKIN_Ptkin14bG0071300 [Pterospermum kingtungense]